MDAVPPFATRRLNIPESPRSGYVMWPGPGIDRRDFKALCRDGLPPHHRASCWARLSGAGTDTESHAENYNRMLNAVFADEVGDDDDDDAQPGPPASQQQQQVDAPAVERGMQFVPNFGGAVAATDVLWQHEERLGGNATMVAAQRLLYVVARTLFGARSRSCASGGEADGSWANDADGAWDAAGAGDTEAPGVAGYAPFLPDLVCVLLRHLREPSVYAVVCAVLERSRNDPDAWLPLCRRDTQALAMAVGALCAKRFSKTGAHLAELGATGAEAYVGRAEGPAAPFELWFERFFVGWVPDASVLRLVDTFLCEGNKAWVYTALGLVKIHKHEMKLRKDLGAMWRYVKASQNSLSPDSLASESFGLTNLTRHGILKLVRSFREELATMGAPSKAATLPDGWGGKLRGKGKSANANTRPAGWADIAGAGSQQAAGGGGEGKDNGADAAADDDGAAAEQEGAPSAAEEKA